MNSKVENCKYCFSKKSAKHSKNTLFAFKDKGFPKISIKASGWKCSQCDETYANAKEWAHIEDLLAREKAKILAKKVKVDDICTVTEASKLLKMTRQGVLKILKNYSVKWVYVGNQKCPLKKDIQMYAKRSA